ncbi:hypothetical protein [Caminibacter pacificus]|uniref:Uncharacterized protein n=1 Tax=Caminibacter pacificus TaxID=1424653 RepID=A0AAJ4RB52_9BACT|nr:hypothetical protein [Caminibacter pacificus]QDD68219.1 hypothetical protein C6V80_10210 [Caminibacter pacificus]ROR38733.1 hypothetical protein EDC58_1948 [Caminibacter pacificus]
MQDKFREFLYKTQYKKKLSIGYFFLTKEGVIFLIIAYLSFKVLFFPFAMLISSWLFLILYRNFSYIYTDKKNIFLVKKIMNFLKGNKNGD